MAPPALCLSESHGTRQEGQARYKQASEIEREERMSKMNHKLYYGDCLDVLPKLKPVTCCFADPPDNLDLDYDGFKDKKPEEVYLEWLYDCLGLFVEMADIVWMSYNAKYTFKMGEIVCRLLEEWNDLEARHCIQTFTFGQHNQRDLGNNHRPLVRFMRKGGLLYPDQIRVPSWRQLHGDKRADPRGKVPGDVFDIPRVTGNSSQRRSWIPTQLDERLIKRCLLLTTKEGDTVLDPFAGSGTTLRVCKEINRSCTLIEYSLPYCKEIGKEHNLKVRKG